MLICKFLLVELITSKEISEAIGADRFGLFGTFIGWMLSRLLKISKLNKVYRKNKDQEGLSFFNGVLKELKIEFEIPSDDLKRIPKTGSFISISNHPLGGIDGILLLKLLIEHRSDYKIIANFLLQRIAPLKPYIMPVNPFEKHKEIKSSSLRIKQTLHHLSLGHPMGIFPAGEVSTYKDGKLMIDKPWELGAMKLIKKAEVPVIPIYFHAKNSRLFYRMSKISHTFRTAKLPSELFTQKHRVIKVRIGKPISVEEQQTYKDLNSLYQFLRKKTYVLAKPFEKKPQKILSAKNLKMPIPPKKISSSKCPNTLVEEVARLRANGNRLFQSSDYEAFLAKAKEIPNLLHEIGRQREITFRRVGEGTNKSLDLDKFDQYYHHLFLWDQKLNVLVGAYRMGLGRDIYKERGIEGFYIQKLFRLKPELYHMMEKTIEMGRSFVIEQYQKKSMPLFLLWRGVLHVALRHPEYRYLIGGVSITNEFSEFSKSLMIAFMKSHYYDPYIAQYVRPRNEFKEVLKDSDKFFAFDTVKSDMQKLDKFIDEIEPGTLRIPVLVKKYLKHNAKLVAFNVDSKFNDAVDGLMYVKISDIPEKAVKPIMEEFQKELEIKKTQEPEN